MSDMFGNRIREARRHLELTTKQASSIAGVNRDTWEKYELGRNDPRHSAVKAVLIDRGIDPDWLFKGEGPMTTKERRALEPSPNDPELVGMLVDNVLRVYSELERSITHRKAGEIAMTAHDCIIKEASDELDRIVRAGMFIEKLKRKPN